MTNVNWQIVELSASDEFEVLACVEGRGRLYVVGVGGPGPTPTDPAEMLRIDVTTADDQPLRLRGGSGRANRDDSVNIAIFDKPDASADALDINVTMGGNSVCSARVCRP